MLSGEQWFALGALAGIGVTCLICMVWMTAVSFADERGQR